MRRISAVWLMAGVMAFGVGFAGALLTAGSASGVATPISTSATQRLSGIAPTRQPSEVEDPELRARIDFLESLTRAELAELPDLVRGVIAEHEGRSDVEKLIPLIDRWIELDPSGGFDFFAAEFEQLGWLVACQD